MHRIQKLFERIAGIPQEEHRGALSLAVYAVPRLDTNALHVPACWRRRALVRGIKR